MKNPTICLFAACVLTGIGIVSQGAFAVEIKHLNSGLILPKKVKGKGARTLGYVTFFLKK